MVISWQQKCGIFCSVRWVFFHAVLVWRVFCVGGVLVACRGNIPGCVFGFGEGSVGQRTHPSVIFERGSSRGSPGTRSSWFAKTRIWRSIAIKVNSARGWKSTAARTLSGDNVSFGGKLTGFGACTSQLAGICAPRWKFFGTSFDTPEFRRGFLASIIARSGPNFCITIAGEFQRPGGGGGGGGGRKQWKPEWKQE